MKRQRYQLLGLCLLTLALGGCGTAPGETDITPGTSDRWFVSLFDSRGIGPIDQCLEDPIIEESIESANLPSTHLSIKFKEAATQEDAERIADCLRQSSGGGNVSITSPKS
ncbi:hypothetical protein [Arthrobacter sp. R4-81]